MNRRVLSALVLAAGTGTLGVPALAEELTLLTDTSADSVAVAKALTEAYSAAHPGITFEIEQRPGGTEGDNIVKTRLATGDMSDVFLYNSGSLMQALKPQRTLEPLTGLPALERMMDSFKTSVSDADGIVYGVPGEAAMGGGIFYNIPLYEKLGLKVPTTWAEFMANNARIKAETTVAPIAQTYRATWTSQLFVLADFYNVIQAVPDFAEKYTANAAKFATTPAALRSFQKLEEVYKAGYFNADFGAATYDDGLKMLATGQAAHYPMLTFAIGALQQNFPDKLKDIGFFAEPGDDADDNGLTIWMPSAFYIPKDSRHTATARDFLDFVASPAGCDVMTKTIGAAGPYMVAGCTLPDDVPRPVKDMLPYFQGQGRAAPALEYLSPVKGPSLEQITVSIGSGIRSAADGAALYDQDVRKQARQLGLPNW